MDFVEKTHRMKDTRVGIKGNPAHPANGKTMAEALPKMLNMRVWSCRHGGYTWAISWEPGDPSWTSEHSKRWVGYTASYRRDDENDRSTPIAVEGGPWKKFTDAEAACRQKWRTMRPGFNAAP